MPAWHDGAGGYIGVKIVSVFPDNAARGKPSVMGTYLLLAGDSGEPLAALDGAGADAVADGRGLGAGARATWRAPTRGALAMVGAGALAPRLIAAHAAVRPIAEVDDLEPHAGGGRALAADARPAGPSRHGERRPRRGGRRRRHRLGGDAVAASRWSAAPG